MSLFNSNIEKLKVRFPALAKRVLNIEVSENVEKIRAKSGAPNLKYESILIHSNYDPEKEAYKFAELQNFDKVKPPVIFGLGLGYHVLYILKKFSKSLYVIEPRLEIFKVFLEQIDITAFMDRVYFIVDEPVPKILARHSDQFGRVIVHPSSAQISKSYYELFCKGIDLNNFIKENSLKILVINPIYGGSLPTAEYAAGALKNLGHQVETVECQNFKDSFFGLKEVTKDQNNSNILSTHFMNLMEEVIVAKTVEFVPDIILAMAQAPLSAKGIQRLKKLKKPIGFWFVEDFKNLTYWKDVAGSYDFFFTIQQGEFLDQLQNYNTVPYYLPQGCWPEYHKPLEENREDKEKYGAEVSFMGAAYYNRIQSFQRLLDFKLKIWGTGWNGNPVFENHLQKNGERVSNEECVKIYNYGQININLHSSNYHESVNPNGDFINPRTFEIAACKAFQLVDKRHELDDLFLPGEEIITFSNLDELRSKIEFYLKNPFLMEEVSKKSRERVLREHTMEHRMKEFMLQVLLNLPSQYFNGIKKRKSSIELAIEEAGKETVLGHYLATYRRNSDISIKEIAEDIKNGEGKLTQNELLILMLDQVTAG